MICKNIWVSKNQYRK